MEFKMTETQKIQKLILYIANEVIRICDKNDIPYNITAGTLLGAVRHKGFIPWDDDFDFAMTRNDYERFLKACKKDLNTDIFFPADSRNGQEFCLFDGEATVARNRDHRGFFHWCRHSSWNFCRYFSL